MPLTRRTFCAIAAAPAVLASPAAAGRLFKSHLTPGSLGVKADQEETIALAAHHGFEAAEPYAEYLTGISDSEAARLRESLAAKELVWGCANLPVEFRRADDQFRADLKKLPAAAKGLRRAGVTRCGTWLSPSHKDLTYLQNFRQHAARLRECATILGDQGLRFGMEYVGPKLLWTSGRYAFVHSMAEMKELIAEIARPNVGFVLDSWHWYTSGETAEDLLTLRNQDVVSVDLNDAPAGVPLDQQRDNVRELPCVTGVIEVATFLSSLVKIGYDGPIRPEPFNATVRALSKDEAVAVSAAAMKKAFALVGPA